MKLVAEPILQARAKLGEGSIWDAARQLLYWVDIYGFLIHTYDPASGINTTIDVGTFVSTIVRRSDAAGGGFIVGLPERIAHVSDEGVITTICELEHGLNNRMNDGKCDPAGRFWCGSVNFEFKTGAANLWMLDKERKLHHKLGNVSISNGIVWSADCKTMYYSDTQSRRIDAFDFDLESGAISNQRVAIENTFEGFWDGMTIDSDDNLYAAGWDSSSVYVLDPIKGRLIDRIFLPGVRNVSSCAFGGKNLNELYITTSADKTNIIDEPNAGALFRIELSGIKGVPANEYAG
jgi:sugar lactone lactonase YvrE